MRKSRSDNLMYLEYKTSITAHRGSVIKRFCSELCHNDVHKMSTPTERFLILVDHVLILRHRIDQSESCIFPVKSGFVRQDVISVALVACVSNNFPWNCHSILFPLSFRSYDDQMVDCKAECLIYHN